MTEKELQFLPGFIPEIGRKQPDLAVVLQKQKVVLKKSSQGYTIPEKSFIIERLGVSEELFYIGTYAGQNCYCMERKEENLIEGTELVELRQVTNYTLDPGLFILTSTANHILHWRSMNRFCGRCGHKTIEKEDERALVCPSCQNLIYPRISPATITAVRKDDKILLAHNKRFTNNVYSLVAGFVEAGETLEQCVAREIMEEVGIKVKNIQYITSQPWSFPDSLMIAFSAEYESGEINPDMVEITDAAWFDAEHLPNIPSSDSVAGKIIRRYQKEHGFHEIS